MKLPFLKNINPNKRYEIKTEHSQVSTIQLISDNLLKVRSPRGKITLVNLQAIAYVERNTKGNYISNVDVPQSVLKWLWTNLQMDEWED